MLVLKSLCLLSSAMLILAGHANALPTVERRCNKADHGVSHKPDHPGHVVHKPVPKPDDQVDHKPDDKRDNNKVDCRNYNTDFTKSLDGWEPEWAPDYTYKQSSKGLELKLIRPDEYKKGYKAIHGPEGAYNKFEGEGPTFNSTSYMHYGSMTAEIQSAGAGGAVTAFILMGDGHDEIDFEWVGEGGKQVQTNYFWGQNIVYGVNGREHDISGSSASASTHTYKIDWTPERIDWYVDGARVRTLEKSATCGSGGKCQFPSQPSRIQISLWDGSVAPGTASWAHGPIDWNKHSVIPAYIKSIKTECNPEYNNIIH